MKQRRRNVFKIGGGGRLCKIISYNFYCQSRRGGCLRSGPIRKVGGGGQSTSGPIYEKWGGRGGGAVHFRSDIRKVGGGGGGAVHFRSDIRKVGGGGGGGAVHFWHTENTLSLIIHGFANRYSILQSARNEVDVDVIW